MYLGLDRLRILVDDPEVKLVENLSSRELTSPEGTGFDLRIGQLSRFVGNEGGLLGISARRTPEIECVAKYDIDEESMIVLRTGDYFLATTIEIINMPPQLVGILRPRGSLFRSGIVLLTGQVNPGYKGELTFGMFNASQLPFKLALGARIVHLLVAQVEGETAPYRGQWQGGRVSAPSNETQI